MTERTMAGKPLGLWEKIEQADYDFGFEALPPVHQGRDYFVLGEPYSMTSAETSLKSQSVWWVYAKVGRSYFRALSTLPAVGEHINALRQRGGCPISAQVVMSYEGRKLLGDVKGYGVCPKTQAATLKVRHFNGEAWPIEPYITQVSVLERDYEPEPEDDDASDR